MALLASAQLMLILDVTVVNVALPDIGAALHLRQGVVPWVMTAHRPQPGQGARGVVGAGRRRLRPRGGARRRAHGYSALHVGLAFLPAAVATVAGAAGGSRILTFVSARVVSAAGLAFAAVGYAIAAGWSQPAALVTGLSIAALGIGATFVTAFTASLADADPAEGGLRSALVNTFHELGGAAGVAVLASAAGAGLVTAQLASGNIGHAFTVGASTAAVSVVIAAVVVPAVIRKPADSPAH